MQRGRRRTTSKKVRQRKNSLKSLATNQHMEKQNVNPTVLALSLNLQNQSEYQVTNIKHIRKFKNCGGESSN